MAFDLNKISIGKINMKIVVMAVAAILLLFFGKNMENLFLGDHPNNSQPRNEQQRTDPAAHSNFNAVDLNYRGKDLILTKHAKCRMGCRFIDAYEVNQVLLNGSINKRKSNENARPCPTFALESKTRDGQLVRVVVAECDRVAKLVTVIDLNNHYKCSCK